MLLLNSILFNVAAQPLVQVVKHVGSVPECHSTGHNYTEAKRAGTTDGEHMFGIDL